jgi:hypothetical protein
MLNSNSVSASHNHLKISAVSGSLQKTHAKSYFQTFHVHSKMAEAFLEQEIAE